MKRRNEVTVIGAGLAGCEAAWQLARRDVPVRLVEMKPHKRSEAHTRDTYAELVCSNSLRGDRTDQAVGLLKEELRRCGSLILEAAEATRVPAGGALAVDRDAFSQAVTDAIERHPDIEVCHEEALDIPEEGIVIVAAGPLCAQALGERIAQRVGAEWLHFFDASAPLVTADSVDMTKAYFGSRYGRGTDDYLNCPMDKEEYLAFWQALCTARQAAVRGFEDEKVFEGCLPVEVLARRGEDALRYGPLKPVGLRDPRTGKGAYAVVQLRRDNGAGSVYNVVGFQTHLTFGEQKRVFSMIPGLGEAEFVRWGVMHRNTFLNSPRLLDEHYTLREDRRIYFAGQITGVEGYVESTASGLVAGIAAACRTRGQAPAVWPRETATGALAHYISNPAVTDFQPMNIHFGLFPAMPDAPRNKRERYAALARRALGRLEEMGV